MNCSNQPKKNWIDFLFYCNLKRGQESIHWSTNSNSTEARSCGSVEWDLTGFISSSKFVIQWLAPRGLYLGLVGEIWHSRMGFWLIISLILFVFSNTHQTHTSCTHSHTHTITIHTHTHTHTHTNCHNSHIPYFLHLSPPSY